MKMSIFQKNVLKTINKCFQIQNHFVCHAIIDILKLIALLLITILLTYKPIVVNCIVGE